MPQFGTTARKHKAILPWNATRCEEKEIKHLEIGQAVQAISQIYNWWGHSTVFIVQERITCRHRRGSTDVAATALEGIYFLLAKWIVNFLCISRTTTISTCSNRDREEYSAAHCWLRGEEAGGKIKTKAAEECVAALQEMGGKLHHQPSGDELDQSSSNKWSQLVIAEDCTLFRMRYSICSSHLWTRSSRHWTSCP